MVIDEDELTKIIKHLITVNNFDDANDEDVIDAAGVDSCFSCILLIGDITAVKMESSNDAALAENKPEDAVDRKPGAVHSGNQFTCSDCDFTTDQQGQYKRHLIHRHHGNTEKPVTSDKKFVPVNDLNSYLKKNPK